MKKATFVGTATAVAIALVTTVGCGASTGNNSTNTTNTTGTGATGNVTLTETGSSLLYPLFNSQWISAYQGSNPNVKLQAASTGSGKGISDATQGLVNIGASDAYMPDAQMTPDIVNIPLAISAQQIMYNLPGMKTDQHLKLTGDVLAKVYMGQIKYWDDAAIKTLNPGVSLPHKAIVPVRRSDGSGDTFLFTQFLSDTNSAWSSKVQYGTTVSWPSVASEVGSKGNDGVEASLKSTPYSVGYVGISWLDRAVSDGIGYAALQNKDGSFVLPTTANIQAAANAMTSKVPADERISLIYAPGKTSYPIINFEYAIVKTKQPDANTSKALVKFLDWAISPTGGNASQYLTPVHFLPLPSSVQPLSQAQINKIQG